MYFNQVLTPMANNQAAVRANQAMSCPSSLYRAFNAFADQPEHAQQGHVPSSFTCYSDRSLNAFQDEWSQCSPSTSSPISLPANGNMSNSAVSTSSNHYNNEYTMCPGPSSPSIADVQIPQVSADVTYSRFHTNTVSPLQMNIRKPHGNQIEHADAYSASNELTQPPPQQPVKQEPQGNVEEADKVQLALTVARLSSLAMQHCTADKGQITSKMLSCNVMEILYKSMFRYPQHTELQREIKDALSTFQNYMCQGTQPQQVPAEQPTTTPSINTDTTSNAVSNSPVNVAATQTSATPVTRNTSNRFIRYLTNADIYECTECGKQYKHVCNLRSHCKIHTEHAFCCEFCGKKFGRRSNWIEHVRTHTGERPFECPVCKKGFKQQYAMKKHMKRHSIVP